MLKTLHPATFYLGALWPLWPRGRSAEACRSLEGICIARGRCVEMVRDRVGRVVVAYTPVASRSWDGSRVRDKTRGSLAVQDAADACQ